MANNFGSSTLTFSNGYQPAVTQTEWEVVDTPPNRISFRLTDPTPREDRGLIYNTVDHITNIVYNSQMNIPSVGYQLDKLLWINGVNRTIYSHDGVKFQQNPITMSTQGCIEFNGYYFYLYSTSLMRTSVSDVWNPTSIFDFGSGNSRLVTCNGEFFWISSNGYWRKSTDNGVSWSTATQVSGLITSISYVSSTSQYILAQANGNYYIVYNYTLQSWTIGSFTTPSTPGQIMASGELFYCFINSDLYSTPNPWSVGFSLVTTMTNQISCLLYDGIKWVYFDITLLKFATTTDFSSITYYDPPSTYEASAPEKFSSSRYVGGFYYFTESATNRIYKTADFINWTTFSVVNTFGYASKPYRLFDDSPVAYSGMSNSTVVFLVNSPGLKYAKVSNGNYATNSMSCGDMVNFKIKKNSAIGISSSNRITTLTPNGGYNILLGSAYSTLIAPGRSSFVVLNDDSLLGVIFNSQQSFTISSKIYELAQGTLHYTPNQSTDIDSCIQVRTNLPAIANWGEYGSSSIAGGEVNGVYTVIVTQGSTAANTFAKSTDMGATWSSITVPSTETWYYVKYNQGVFIASGTNGRVIYSVNAGVSWNSMPIIAEAGTTGAIPIVISDGILVAAFAKSVFISSDFANWKTIALPADTVTANSSVGDMDIIDGIIYIPCSESLRQISIDASLITTVDTPIIRVSTPVNKTVVPEATAPGSSSAIVTVTGQAGIKSTSTIDVWIQGSDFTADHNQEEHKFTPIDLIATNIVPDVGFDIIAHTELRLRGDYKVRWAWSD